MAPTVMPMMEAVMTQVISAGFMPNSLRDGRADEGDGLGVEAIQQGDHEAQRDDRPTAAPSWSPHR